MRFGRYFIKARWQPTRRSEIQLVADPTTGVVTPKMMYHARRTETEDGATSVQITLDESDIEQVRTIVQRERRRAGMDPMPESEIQDLFAKIRQNTHTLEQPQVRYDVKVDIFHYQRAVCKIIYELACIWLGDSYLDDPVAQQFRDIVLLGKEEAIAGRIQLDGNCRRLTCGGTSRRLMLLSARDRAAGF